MKSRTYFPGLGTQYKEKFYVSPVENDVLGILKAKG